MRRKLTALAVLAGTAVTLAAVAAAGPVAAKQRVSIQVNGSGSAIVCPDSTDGRSPQDRHRRVTALLLGLAPRSCATGSRSRSTTLG